MKILTFPAEKCKKGRIGRRVCFSTRLFGFWKPSRHRADA